MPRHDRFLGNNLLGNRPNPPPTPWLPSADLEFDSPNAGTLSFECHDQEHLDLVAMYLQAQHPSALLDNYGGRVFLTAPGEIVSPDRFPARITIHVEIVDEPGPVEL